MLPPGPPYRAPHGIRAPFTFTDTMYQRILVPFDGSPAAMRGLEEALALAKQEHARLRIMFVVDDHALAFGGHALSGASSLRDDASRLLEATSQRVREAGIEGETALHDMGEGSVAECVHEEAARWPADLIVLGLHGRQGRERPWLGGRAAGIVRGAPVPVLMAPNLPRAPAGP